MEQNNNKKTLAILFYVPSFVETGWNRTAGWSVQIVTISQGYSLFSIQLAFLLYQWWAQSMRYGARRAPRCVLFYTKVRNLHPRK